MKTRTSLSHPLRIDERSIPGCAGTIGLTFCPGKKGPSNLGPYVWDRDLSNDTTVISKWNPDVWLNLMEPHEMHQWGVGALPAAAGSVAKYFNLPITDTRAPGRRFASGWVQAGPAIHACLRAGGKVLIHCRGGLGRAGTIAAQLLVEFGQDPEAAIQAVRRSRVGAIENTRQENYVKGLVPKMGTAAFNLNSPKRAERARGGVLGLLVGDALGVPHEFKAARDVPPHELIEMVMPTEYRKTYAHVPYGTWSDDGAQALCLLETLLDKGDLVPEDLGNRLLKWRDEGYMAVDAKCYDIGNQTNAALSRLRAGTPALRAGGSDPSSAGNGSLMRVLGLALWHQGSTHSLFEMAMRQSIVTHGSPIARLCCALYCGVARQLLEGVEAMQAWERAIAEIQRYCQDDAELALVLQRDILDSKLRTHPAGSGYVVDALWSAQACLRETDYPSVVRAAIAMGNDTDTTAAIAGGLAGIIYGETGIPTRWLANMRGLELAMPALRGLESGLNKRNSTGAATGEPPLLANILSRHNLGNCQRYRNLCVIPLLAPTGVAATYDLLDSAIASGTANVAETSESGSVPELAFRNLGRRPVLLIDGEELRGARQNRILNISILADVATQIVIPVSCVERGRWAYHQRHFDTSDRILFGSVRRAKATAVTESLRNRGTARSDQGRIWQMIDDRFSASGRTSDTDAMSDLYAAEQDELSVWQEAFEWLPNQAGAVFAIDGEPVAVELFDSPETFQRFLRKAIGSFAMDGISSVRPINREPDPANVGEFLLQIGQANVDRFKAVGAGHDLRLSGNSVAGGALEVEGQVLHLSAFRP
ncbi:MAG: ADP-ribosylglycohydrolase family protein [Comamonadaceae bacterium]